MNKMPSEGIVIIGAGGHAKAIIATLNVLNIDIQAILDDDESKLGCEILGITISGLIASLRSGSFKNAILAIGDNKKRKYLAETYNDVCRWSSLIHPAAYVYPNVKIGEGSVIFAGAVIQPDVIIGNHVIINTSASVDHDCAIEDFVHIAPGTNLAGNVIVKEGAFLGVGCSVIPNVTIGKWSIIGAGSVVINDIPDYAVAVGVPARQIKKIDGGQI
jgi:sugar O-acyltransferase (sialic acid O-acetyltransferase NeuD family)